MKLNPIRSELRMPIFHVTVQQVRLRTGVASSLLLHKHLLCAKHLAILYNTAYSSAKYLFTCPCIYFTYNASVRLYMYQSINSFFYIFTDLHYSTIYVSWTQYYQRRETLWLPNSVHKQGKQLSPISNLLLRSTSKYPLPYRNKTIATEKEG